MRCWYCHGWHDPRECPTREPMCPECFEHGHRRENCPLLPEPPVWPVVLVICVITIVLIVACLIYPT